MTKHTILAIVPLTFVAVNAVRHAQASNNSYYHCSACSLKNNEVADRLPLFNALFLVLQVK